MSADRHTPTSGPLSGADYATAVDEEIASLNDRSICKLSSVAGTNTITASATPPLQAYAAPQTYSLIPVNTNTGPVTINISGVGPRAVTDSFGAALGGGELVAGRLTLITDDGTKFRIPSDAGAELEEAVGLEIDDDNPFTGGPLEEAIDGNAFVARQLNRDGSTYIRPDFNAMEHIAASNGLMQADRLLLILRYGQSNGNSQAGSALTRRSPGPSTCLHMANHRHSPGNTVVDLSDATCFVPALEDRYIHDTNEAEGSGSSSLMRWLDRSRNASRWPKEIYCAANSSLGARTVEELSEGSAYPTYANMIAAAAHATLLADRKYNHLPTVVPFVYWFHGESASASAAAYSTALQAMRSGADADIKAVTRQSQDVHFICVQVSSDESTTSVPTPWLGLVQARNAVPTRIHIASPRYWVSLIDNTHLTALSQAIMDEYAARCAMRMVAQLGGTDTAISSLRVVRATRSGAVWTLRCRKPAGAGNIYSETTLLPSITTSLGFRATDGGSPDTISSVAFSQTSGNDGVVDYDCTITVTLDGAPAGAAYLTYANGSGTTGQDRPAAWGNVAVHSSDVSLASPGRELVDWLEIFEATT